MKKWLAWILTLAMIIGILPVDALNVSAETTDHNVETQAGEDEYGIMTLSGTTPVVRVQKKGEEEWKYYNTMDEAFTAIGAGGSATVELMRDLYETELYNSGKHNFSVGTNENNNGYNQASNLLGDIVITGGEDGKKIIGNDSGAGTSHLINNYAIKLTLQNLTFEGISRGGILWNGTEKSKFTASDLAPTPSDGQTKAIVILDNIKIAGNSFSNYMFCTGSGHEMDLILQSGTNICDNFTTTESTKRVYDAQVTLTNHEGCTASDSTYRTAVTNALARIGMVEYQTIMDAIGTVADGQSEATTITILRDAFDTECNSGSKGTIEVYEKKIIIDGQGHTITGNNTSGSLEGWGHMINVRDRNSYLEIRNLSFKKLQRGGLVWYYSSAGTIILTDVEISDCTFNSPLFGDTNVAANLTLNNTKIVKNTDTGSATNLVVTAGTTTTLKGNTIITGNTRKFTAEASKLIVAEDFTGTVEIGSNTGAEAQFATASENYDPASGIFLNTANSAYGVKREGAALKWVNASDLAVAKVGDTSYSSFSKALDAVKDGGTIQLLRDLTDADLLAGENLSVKLTKSVTITSGGRTITAGEGSQAINNPLFVVAEGKSLSIQNVNFDGLKRGTLITAVRNNQITLTDTKVQNFEGSSTAQAMISAQTAGVTVSLENTSIINNRNSLGISTSQNLNVTVGGNTVIKGNTNDEVNNNIIVDDTNYLNIQPDFTGKIGITGPVAEGTKFAKVVSSENGTLNDLNGLINEADSFIKAESVTENGVTYLQWETREVAVIVNAGEQDENAVKYKTLAAAIEAYEEWAENQVIRMTADTTEADIILNKNIYLDLAGHTVNANITGENSKKLYGLDSTTDGYINPEKGAGKIVGTVNCAEAVTDTTADRTRSKMRYMQIKSSEGIEFHAFKLALKRVDFWLSTVKNQATLEYTCYLKGDGIVLNAVDMLGFSVCAEGGEEKVAYITKATGLEHLTAQAVNDNGTGNDAVTYKVKVVDSTKNVQTANYTTSYTVKASLMTKAGVEIQGSDYKNSFLGVVYTASYQKGTARNQAIIDKFMKDNQITDAWDEIKNGS